MRYYTIQNENQIFIADSEQALSRFYEGVYELPEDYQTGKYIIGDAEMEIDVPDYDEEGNPIIIDVEETVIVIDYDEEGNPIGEHEETVIKHVPSTHKETILVKRLVPNPEWDDMQKSKREAEFNKSFFNTSLGYIRRSVTMADGSHKDFLSDLLPVISMGVQSGQTVHILAYDKPSFDDDVTDWEEYQNQVTVTPQFITECFMQLSNDFLPINEE